MGSFISRYVGTTASQRSFLLLLVIQSLLDMALGLIYLKHMIPLDKQPHNLQHMMVANTMLGLCFIAVFIKTNVRQSPLQLWGVVGVLFALAAWEPIVPVLTTMLPSTDPYTNEPYTAGTHIIVSIRLGYRIVFLAMYLIMAIHIHRSYMRFHQVVMGYITKPSYAIKHAWNVRFKFVSIMGVHAIQVIACVVAMFYMMLPHADIGHASVIVVVAVKAVAIVSASLGMLGAAWESKWLMYGCILSLTSELVFFAYVAVYCLTTNYAWLTSNHAASWIMMYGALSSLALSIISILVTLVHASMTIKTFGFGLSEWVAKEYNHAVKMATTNPFKE